MLCDAAAAGVTFVEQNMGADLRKRKGKESFKKNQTTGCYQLGTGVNHLVLPVGNQCEPLSLASWEAATV